jgi:hypothetical protein
MLLLVGLGLRVPWGGGAELVPLHPRNIDGHTVLRVKSPGFIGIRSFDLVFKPWLRLRDSDGVGVDTISIRMDVQAGSDHPGICASVLLEVANRGLRDTVVDIGASCSVADDKGQGVDLSTTEDGSVAISRRSSRIRVGALGSKTTTIWIGANGSIPDGLWTKSEVAESGADSFAFSFLRRRISGGETRSILLWVGSEAADGDSRRLLAVTAHENELTIHAQGRLGSSRNIAVHESKLRVTSTGDVEVASVKVTEQSATKWRVTLSAVNKKTRSARGGVAVFGVIDLPKSGLVSSAAEGPKVALYGEFLTTSFGVRDGGKWWIGPPGDVEENLLKEGTKTSGMVGRVGLSMSWMELLLAPSTRAEVTFEVSLGERGRRRLK